MSVDEEVKATLVQRTLRVDECTLQVQYSAASAKVLRVAVNGFLEALSLVVSVFEAFQPDGE